LVDVNEKKVHIVYMGIHKERKSDTLTVRMTPRIKAAFDSLAGQERQTVSSLASSLLAEWITENHPDLIPPPPEKNPEPPEGMFKIPIYDVRAAAGSGSFISEENLEASLDFTEDLASSLGVAPEHLAGLRVAGDSMEPELLPGDVVLINTHLDPNGPLVEDIHVFSLNGQLHIKRLRRLPEGSIQAISTNPTYVPMIILADSPGQHFRLLGRVVMRWRRMG